MTITMMDPRDLKNNPSNIEVYGGTPPGQEFVDSISDNGVLEPITAEAESLVIISGHQRRAASIMAKLKSVPVRLVTFPDEDEQLLRLIECNRQRVKTKEQIVREYKKLAEVQERLAKKRMATKGGSIDPGQETGRAKDLAAAEVGMSRATAERGSVVLDEIDSAEESGDTERAEDLRESLNNGSVSGAAKKARAKEETEEQTKNPGSWLTPLISQVGSVESAIKKAMADEQPGPELLTLQRWGQEFLTKIRNAKAVLQDNRPHGVCLTCNGKKKAKACKDCLGSGQMTKRQLETREAR